MPPTVDSRRLDVRVWSIATRSSPVVIQFVLGVLLVATWLLGRWSLFSGAADAPRAEVLAATGIAVVLSVGVAAALFRRDSSMARGIGLSTAASAAVVLIGAIPYACWLL
ncbi:MULTISPECIES: hypothetical protein [unclassified Mycobacterium]|uniref:hypothetical protein n=1 Tax=unclassified Mycobacterium TaxID=2642494 RepID=UPI0029C68BDA|nr:MULTISPECIES: hypothetical protein [unclassified Mycobacterium]